MSSVPERSEIETEYTWDLESLYATDEDWEEAYADVEESLADLEAYEGDLTEDSETLLAALETREELFRKLANVASYARMRRDEDTRDQEYQALTARSQSLATDASSAASFIEPALQDCTREELDAMAEEVPELEEYDHYFDDVLRMKPHTRSAEIEALLADLGEVTGAASEVYNMLTNADMEFPTVEDPDGEVVEISLNNFTTLQKNPDREFRQEVYEQFYDEWEGVRNSVGAAHRNSVKADVKLAEARNYDTAREAALDGANIPVEVYDTLVETVHNNLDLLHRHADLKRESLGVDELQMWDLYMPMVDSESPEVTYEEAKDHVVEALAPLGEAYQERVIEGLDSRWVDVYENKGKSSGAYSGGTYDSQPYILMNYQDEIESMFTLAHELGHSMHSELASEAQPYVYGGYEIFVAEVASTVNEALLTHHLLDTVEDEQFSRHVLNEYLERFRSTLIRQTHVRGVRTEDARTLGGRRGADARPARFDLRRSEGGVLRAGGRGRQDRTRVDADSPLLPAFYVYQYTTGISAAVALAEGIREDGEDAAEPYREFLASGSHGYPIELLRGAGVDMTTADPIEARVSRPTTTTLTEFADLT